MPIPKRSIHSVRVLVNGSECRTLATATLRETRRARAGWVRLALVAQDGRHWLISRRRRSVSVLEVPDEMVPAYLDVIGENDERCHT